jgi:hypothetical protein
MLFNVSGRVTSVKELHPKKVSYSMLSTLAGMIVSKGVSITLGKVTLVKAVHS